MRGKPHKCRTWLERCAERGYLQRATRWQLAYFDSVAHCDWWQQLLARERAAAAAATAATAAAAAP